MSYRKRNVELKLRVTEWERQLITERMAQAGVLNTNAYLLKMAIDGYIVRLDLSEVKELVSLLRRCSNNLNQIAKRVNETGRLYEADVEGLREQLDGVWEGARKILALLSKLE